MHSKAITFDTEPSQTSASYTADREEVDSVVLLYSGGLDTSVMVHWIQEHYDAEVITVTLDLGQPGVDLDAIRQKALDTGAEEAVVVDAKQEFAEEYVAAAIKANALYQGQYPLSSAIARYLTMEKAVEVAKHHGADAVAHGCTGKGNDQVRFDSTVMALDKDLQVIAPVREWSMTRDKEIAYAEEHGIPVEETDDSPYSTDENLWGKSSECGPLDDPGQEPPDDVFEFVTVPENAPDEPAYVDIGFEDGIPVTLDGEQLPLHALIMELNEIAGQHGVGIVDMSEDRVVGLKSREIYECPAAVTLLQAHEDLQKFCSTKHENSFKQAVEQQWAELAYSGLWHDPLMDHLNAFLDSINTGVTGTVTVKLYKGSAQVVGRESAQALYDHNLATYEAGETFNHDASPGFIELWSLQTKLANEVTDSETVDG
ncbi:MAG: argininosuccinate synthase [Candidatus Nanohaloarchaea archaeon]|nr:argininosuccinate synthase [Candidatus Nanohaloarchaea archaeon]